MCVCVCVCNIIEKKSTDNYNIIINLFQQVTDATRHIIICIAQSSLDFSLTIRPYHLSLKTGPLDYI